MLAATAGWEAAGAAVARTHRRIPFRLRSNGRVGGGGGAGYERKRAKPLARGRVAHSRVLGRPTCHPARTRGRADGGDLGLLLFDRLDRIF